MSSSDFLPTLIQILDREHVGYALIGAFAMLARNASRTTLDVDFLTTESRVLAIDWKAALAGKADAEVRRGDFDDPLAGVVRLKPPADLSFDIVVGKWKWQKEIVERSDVMTVRGLPLHVARVADLCLMKIDAGGPKDLHDVEFLLERNPDAESELRALVPTLPSRLQQEVQDFLSARA